MHRFLHLLRGLVYIYYSPKSANRRVTGPGSGEYLPTTSPLRLHMLQDGGVLNAAFYRRRRRRPIDYTNLHGGKHTPRTYSHIHFQKFLDPFQGPPGLKTPIFEFPFSRYVPSHFSPRLQPDSRFADAVDTYLQSHPYTKTYYVTSTSSSTSHRVSSWCGIPHQPPSPATLLFLAGHYSVTAHLSSYAVFFTCATSAILL